MRQFDESLQRLGRLLFTFFSEEKIESHHEREALLKMSIEQMCEGYMLAKSTQAGFELVERHKNHNQNN